VIPFTLQISVTVWEDPNHRDLLLFPEWD